ncbi:IS607 family transposase [Candidatus Thorarchaeota archaeon]|nr:MAG: IS607 family transposase [Candidatus Thorarchaeota archaeon]
MFSVSQAARRLGVCTKTVRRWDTRGFIQCVRTPGNHRRIPLSEVNRILGVFHREVLEHPAKKRCAVYARVSGHRQKTDGDLDRQLKTLTAHCRSHFKTRPLVFTDIGSGLNMKRRGLRRLLALAQSGAINTLLITHRDRLARFGVDLLQRILEDYGVKLFTLMENENRTPQEELVTVMMALIASFSGRVYGLRAAALRDR